MVKGYYIQYKFILPETVKHSTYTYQKLFRAIYGYTQNVTKSNGKIYHYHRKGVLSDSPYLRPGKNAVIIHPDTFPKFKQFFATGQNPSHRWRSKGDWKAVYYMDEKEIDSNKAITALEDLADRTYVSSADAQPTKLEDELSIILDKYRLEGNIDTARKQAVLTEAENLVSHDWFKQSVGQSQKLTEINEKVKLLRGL